MWAYKQALESLLQRTPVLHGVEISAARALGRVLAEAIISADCLPGFTHSAMDGFALSAGSQLIAEGVEWDVAGVIAAGQPDLPDTAHGQAWEIMTGARMPEGLDTVVPLEQVDPFVRPDSGTRAIRLRATLRTGQNVRIRGEDVSPGMLLMPAGETLSAHHLMLLAALGIDTVKVMRRARVAIINSGRELDSGDDAALAGSQIRDSNGPFLQARLASLGADIVMRTRVPDDAGVFTAALTQALDAGADLVVSTGAVSAGLHDFIPDALSRFGADIVFHKIRMRPGKPVLFAQLPGGQRYLGLPGNPISTVAACRLFVQPALRAMHGLAPELPLRAALSAAVEKKAGYTTLQHGRLHCDADGQLRIRLSDQQGPSRMLALLGANAWALLPESAGRLEAGETVDVYRMDSGSMTEQAMVAESDA